MIDRNHPAAEAARRALANDETNGCMIEQHEGNGMWTCFAHGVSADGPEMCWYVRDMPPIVLEVASEHYTAADLRDTPAGKQLMAEAWDQAVAANDRAWNHAYDGHPVNPDSPYYECTSCDTTNPYRDGDA